jgi:hypothetical protein
MVASKAAGRHEPQAYPLGRTVRRIRSTTFVRAAEPVRRPGPRGGFVQAENAARGHFQRPFSSRNEPITSASNGDV